MKVVSIDPEIMWGTPCFTGTRVPVQTIFDYIVDGHTIEEFHQSFPEVTREQTSEVLKQASEVDYANRKTA